MNWEGIWQKRFAGEIAWLKKARQDGLNAFLTQGLPNTKMEDWRYLRLRELERLEFAESAPEAGRQSFEKSVSVFGGDSNDNSMAFQNNGVFSLREAALKKSQPFWGQWADLTHPFCALNTAFWEDGLFVELGEQKTLQLGACFLSDTPLTMHHWRNWIHLQENSRAQLLLRWQGQGEKSLTTTVSEIVVDPGAMLTLNLLDSSPGYAFHPLFITLRDNAHLQLNILMMQSAIARQEIVVRLDGAHATCDIAGFLWGNHKRQVDLELHIDHLSPQAKSTAHIRALGRDQAKVIVNGKITVEQGAFQSEARLEAHQLLLSADAEVDIRPQLEIYNDDVQCAHGATVGKLDEEALFYFKSRGIERRIAEEILTYAFARAPFAELPEVFKAELVRVLPGTDMEAGHV